MYTIAVSVYQVHHIGLYLIPLLSHDFPMITTLIMTIQRGSQYCTIIVTIIATILLLLLLLLSPDSNHSERGHPILPDYRIIIPLLEGI